jgi:HAD superfamily hydrolase (TIGR01509 family)
MRSVQLVIFDCDGVLADSEVISARVLVAELRRYGVTLDEDYVIRNFVGQSFPKVAAKIRSSFQLDVPQEFEAAYRTKLVDAFAEGLSRMPGVGDVLDHLDSAKCVATSSSPPRVARTLRITGLVDYFKDDVFTASEVPNGKPAPDLFLHAAARMQVAPENCLVIEDSMAGILAANAAGMAVWRYVGGSHMKGFSTADLATPAGVPVFDNWAEFYHMAPQLKRKGAPDGQICR